MHPDYLADRIPVIPPSVHIGEKLHAFHIEGSATEQVDGVVKVIGPGKEPDTTRITYITKDDKKHSRELRDSCDWVSVAFPRSDSAPARDVLEAAA